jgi:hypothetical protein
LPRSVKTIDDLLSKDDVNEAIDILVSRKKKIKKLVIIHINDDDTWGTVTTDMTNCDLLWYLELVKNDLFNDNDD